MSRSASVPLMLDTATIDPPGPASTIARATARIVSQVPVRLVSMTAARQRRSGPPTALTPRCRRTRRAGRVSRGRRRSLDRRRHRAGSLISQSMSPPRGPTPRRRRPHCVTARRPRCRSGPTAGDDGVIAGGPISSTRTPSGAVITAIATVSPPGAGISMRRTPSSKPSSASQQRRVDLALQRQQKEAERRTVRRRRLASRRRTPPARRCRSRGRPDRRGRPTAADRSRAEQRRPVADEGLVEQLGETQAVAPEPLRALDVRGDYRRVVDSGHVVASFRPHAVDS